MEAKSQMLASQTNTELNLTTELRQAMRKGFELLLPITLMGTLIETIVLSLLQQNPVDKRHQKEDLVPFISNLHVRNVPYQRDFAVVPQCRCANYKFSVSPRSY